MISSLRGLVAFGAIAIVLGVVLVVVRPAQPVVVDRSLLADHELGALTGLSLTLPGKPATIATRGEPWMIGSFPADMATVDGVLTALRAAKWHRRDAAAVAGPARSTLETLGAVHRFALGRELPGSEQTWIVRDGTALLVDSWVARALFPDPIALRVRRPFADAATAVDITGPNGVGFVHTEQRQPIARWIAAEPLRALTDALAAVEIVSVDGIHAGEGGRAIKVGPTRAVESGTCDGNRIHLVTTVGHGCVERAAWERAVAAFAPYERDDASLVDTRVVPFAPAVIRYPDRIQLLLDRQPPSLGTDGTVEPADIQRVAELLGALAEPAAIVPLPAGAPRTTLLVTGKDADIELKIYADVVVRDTEAFALRPAARTLELLVRGHAELREPLLWREDPVTLTSFTLNGVTYKRGAVLGEWTREPAGPLDAAVVDALAQSLATVRGRPSRFAPKAMMFRLDVTFTPPAGGPTTHALELAPPGTDGCQAHVDGKGMRLELPLCTVVAAVASS